MKKLIISSISLLAAIAFFSLPFVSCNNAPEKQVGLQLYTLRDSMNSNPVATIEEVGKVGYRIVEAAGYRDGKFYGMTPVEFKALCDKNGLNFLSSHTGMPAPDSANWASTMAWWDTCIAAHIEAGVKYIVQPWMGDTAYKSLAGLNNYIAYFNAVGEKCNAKGIRFGYHNHDREFQKIDSVVIYDHMLQNTDPAKVFFQMDLWWITVGGANPVEYFTKYPGRFELWHVKDELEIGASGKMDFKPIFENAALSGMKYYIVEQEAFATTPFEGIKASIDFLLNAPYVKQ
ncbi:MAG: sugar phosphate isomerase/epimerase [Bacteroidales bacterium]